MKDPSAVGIGCGKQASSASHLRPDAQNISSPMAARKHAASTFVCPILITDQRCKDCGNRNIGDKLHTMTANLSAKSWASVYQLRSLVNRIVPTRTALKRNIHTQSSSFFQISEEVQHAINSKAPVVALESAIYTHGGHALGRSVAHSFDVLQVSHIPTTLPWPPTSSLSSGSTVEFRQLLVL